MIKIFVSITLFIILTITINSIIPVSLNTNILNQIEYFLNYINYLNGIIEVDVLFICIKILINFYFGIILLWGALWIVKWIKN